jgi:HK97 family phage major capsid protein
MHTKTNALAEWVLANAASRHVGVSGPAPLQICAERFGVDALSTRALLASIGSAGGYLVPQGLSLEVISALRANAVVRRATPPENVIPMPRGNIRIGRETATATTRWIGEDTQVLATEPKFGEILMQSKKILANIPISNDLLRWAEPGAAEIVERGLLKQLASAEDLALLTGIGAYQPTGLRWSANTANASTGSTAAEVIADLRGLAAALESASVRMIKPTWFVSTVGREFLATLTSTATGLFQFPSMDESKLFGWPVMATTNLSGVILLVDMADFYLGQGPVEVSVHASATYTTTDGSKVVNTFDLDESMIRIVSSIDGALAHPESAAVLTGASWA